MTACEDSGLPMARAMVIDHPQNANAWKYDLQYMWGESMLIAPNCADSGSVQLWLPDRRMVRSVDRRPHQRKR
jgi:alpha-glucosidase (family GH31 glycosyl hydrolase)